MSISQIAPFLNPGPKLTQTPDNNRHMYVWVYGSHFDWETFAGQCNGTLTGAGGLKNWTWHINQLGEVNIRRNFMADYQSLLSHQYVAPAPAQRISSWDTDANLTFGWTIQVAQKDDELIHQLLGKDRVRTVQKIRTLISMNPPRSVEMPAIVYWDPRNTCDLGRRMRLSEQSKQAWFAGIELLQQVGVPLYFLNRVRLQLNGEAADVEPLLVCPTQLVKKGMDLRRAETPEEEKHEIHLPLALINPREMRFREGGKIYRDGCTSNTPVLERVQIRLPEKAGSLIAVLKGVALLNQRARIFDRSVAKPLSGKKFAQAKHYPLSGLRVGKRARTPVKLNSKNTPVPKKGTLAVGSTSRGARERSLTLER